jgi:predicted GIY-YIG superfamily endonuclease
VKWRRKRTRYTSKPHPGRTAVYQFRDRATQDHLYVGITNNPERRFSQHAGLGDEEKKWWWDQADHRHVTITWYSTRRQALAVEDRLIKQLRPPGNKLGNPDWEKSTTWRPQERPTPAIFRGAAKPILVAIIAWTFPIGAATQAIDPPSALVVGGLIVGIVSTRLAWRRITA